jgi:5-formyltetrahydrofolate cyclo-ligase
MDQSTAGRKAELRRLALARRDAMAASDREAASGRIVERLAELIGGRRPGSVSATVPIRSEADVLPLLNIAAERGIETVLPSMVDHELAFRQWQPGDPLVEGAFGVPEPTSESPMMVPDIVVMPLAAFDRRGNRLGYGKGHFDRTLAGLLAGGARPLLVGAAFAVQEVEPIPAEAHDIALDIIVTEDEIIEPPAGA